MSGSSTAPARDANLLGALLVAGGDAVRDAVESEAPSAASAPGALVALLELADGATIGELGEIVGLGHSGTVRLADRLEAGGLLTRERQGRTVTVHLTRSGRATARRVIARRREAIERLLEPLGAAERRDFTATLERLLDALGPLPADGLRACRLCEAGVCRRGELSCPIDSAAKRLGMESK